MPTRKKTCLWTRASASWPGLEPLTAPVAGTSRPATICLAASSGGAYSLNRDFHQHQVLLLQQLQPFPDLPLPKSAALLDPRWHRNVPIGGGPRSWRWPP
ncbi:hypothetical protein NL676_035037 [Syzygium grande]|nr:hypothetical protein NL676_035037 [Syzygium grande]